MKKGKCLIFFIVMSSIFQYTHTTMKLGLVLEGGGMRGMYTAGVMDVMLENNIHVDSIVGVSAGAAFGCNYKSKQIGRVIRYNTKFCKDQRYSGFSSFIKTGDFFGADFCYNTIPNMLDVFDTSIFKSTPEQFYVVCTDVVTGKPIYHELKTGNSEDLKWMRASASMPIVSKMVEINNQKLLDGGISDSIPLSFLKQNGCERNIVILTQQKGYVKKQNSFLPLIKMVYKKYPAIVEGMKKRHIMYNDELKYVQQEEDSNNAFVFRPSRFVKISRTEKNPEKLLALYSVGREDAISRLQELKCFAK